MRGHFRNSALAGMLATVALLAPSTSADAAYGLGLIGGIIEDYHQGNLCGNGSYCQGAFGRARAYGGLDTGYYPWGPGGPVYGGYAIPVHVGPGMPNVHAGTGAGGGLFHGASGGRGRMGGYRQGFGGFR